MAEGSRARKGSAALQQSADRQGGKTASRRLVWGGGEDRKWQGAARDLTVSLRKQKRCDQDGGRGLPGTERKALPLKGAIKDRAGTGKTF